MSDQPSNVKKVLFVDDNLPFLEMIERVLGDWSHGEWQIFIAQNTGAALLMLQEHAIDLVVVDVQMPVVDGVQFLALLNRKYPGVQKVSLSAFADEAARAQCLSQGAELFFEKPRGSEDLEVIFTNLRELLRQKPSSGFRGVLRQVSLEDVIQMECLNRNSSILEINAGSWRGQIFIKEGAVIHAQAGERNGEAALNKILGLKGGEFNLKPFTEPPQQSIDGPWEFLLMEAARVRDETSDTERIERARIEAETAAAAEATVLEAAQAAAASAAPAAPSPESGVIIEPVPEPEPVATPPLAQASVAPALNGNGAPEPVRPTRIDEMVICSAKGEVLYEWQCANANDRISFLEYLSQKSTQLGEGLGLGPFDRLEIEGGRSRVIAQVRTNRGVFLRATKGTPGRSLENNAAL